MEDIDDPRNGLLLAKPIEWAFDTSQLCFIYDKDFNHYSALLLNRALAAVHLADKLEELLKVHTWLLPLTMVGCYARPQIILGLS